MVIHILRIAALVIALLSLVLVVVMLTDHLLTGLWLVPEIFVLLLLVWYPEKLRKKKT